MNRIAKFEKVSQKRFCRDYLSAFPELTETEAKEAYERLRLPERATSGSAGYDFYLTDDLTLRPGETVKLPTGIRCRMVEGWVLMIFPRSGLGFKYRLQLNNTVGVIDSDYYGSDNEGHIFVRLTNDSNEKRVLSLRKGDAFVQGVFLPYGITEDDRAEGIRNGGFGSTSKA